MNTTDTGWEERFDEKYLRRFMDLDIGSADVHSLNSQEYTELKAFIASEREEAKREVVEFIRKNSALSVRLYDTPGDAQESEDIYEIPANALEAALTHQKQ